MRGSLTILCLLWVLGCDVGDPVLPDTVGLSPVDRADILLLEWQAQGAIPAADVNGDGTVDIADLVVVSQNFGLDVPVGALTILPDIAWREEHGKAHGRVEVINNGDGPVTGMRLRYLVRVDGLLVDIDDGTLLIPLIPDPTKEPTYIAPGQHGTAWLWAFAADWEGFQAGTVTIEVAVIRDEDSFHAGQTP